MIDRNHPGVKAAHFASLGKSTVSGQTWADALAAALPHLTAEDLRDTPAGQALMAEGWDQGYLAGEDDARLLREAEECHPNPYLEGDA